ncbi:MAG: hypothetical protein JWM52_855 [Candidatus Saccharibacteria bacterium]|nr:hypothetical protein [Candidatus Saccharibacteria bacterium]
MSSFYIHPHTQSQINHFREQFPQSLLIHGPHGIGLGGMTTHLSAQLGIVAQVILPERDEKVDLEKGTITVDSIRRIYDMVKTIETGRRLIVIDYAERMGSQAQNAFLKLLEEPGKNTHFVLLSHDVSKMLPTIRSRAQELELRHITDEQSAALLDDLGVTDSKKRTQLLFIASGLPAELTRLATDDDFFTDRSQIVRDAQLYLQSSVYDRLTLATKYKDDRQKALLMLNDALKLLQTNVQQGKSNLIPKIEQLITAYERVEANGSIRLQLSQAMV